MRPSKRSHAATRRAIALLGGGTKTARAIGVDKSDVSHWKRGDRVPSLKWAIQLANATNGKVKAAEIRPELANIDGGR